MDPAGIVTEHNGFIQVDGTNNIAELTAAIESLRSLPMAGCHEVLVITDSQYVVNGVTEWAPGWIRKGWKTADGKPVKNKDLWIRLMAEVQRRPVRFQWVRGHNGHPENERADELANAGLQLAGQPVSPPEMVRPAQQLNLDAALPTEIPARILEAVETARRELAAQLAQADDTRADQILVETATARMDSKLLASRQKGRGGWHTDRCRTAGLEAMLREHIDKGDMADVLNLAAMILVRREAGLP